MTALAVDAFCREEVVRPKFRELEPDVGLVAVCSLAEASRLSGLAGLTAEGSRGWSIGWRVQAQGA